MGRDPDRQGNEPEWRSAGLRLSLSGPGFSRSFSLTDSAPPYNTGSINPGTYSASETVPQGWDQTSATCSDGSPVTAISLQDGETVTCTFTNTKLGRIMTIESSTPKDPQDFFFTDTIPGCTVGPLDDDAVGAEENRPLRAES